MKKYGKKKYRINKMRLMFVLMIALALISLVLWMFSSVIGWIYNIVITHDNVSTKENVLQIDVSNTLMSSTKTYASEMEDKIDYSKKPNGLKKSYYEFIIEISEREKIPYEVVLAIITTENSSYDEYAYNINENESIDLGLCQINSEYIEYFANTYDIEDLNPFDPHDSITFVARHMKYLSDYGIHVYGLNELDSYIFAAGAYNRGLSNECLYRNMYEYKEIFLKNYKRFI